MFTVDFGKYTESFRYGQFFEKGSEVVRVRKNANGYGNRFVGHYGLCAMP